MTSYVTDPKLFVTKAFYFSRDSSVSVERKYGREFSVSVKPSRGIIYRTVKQFEDTGNVRHKHVKEHDSSASLRAEETVDATRWQ
jgi:Fe2+ or Zn2+ uptake regulation protein